MFIFAHLCRLWVLLFSMGLLYVYFCPLVQALGTTIQYGSPLCIFLPTCTGSGCYYSVWVSLYLFLPTCTGSGCYYSVWVSFMYIFAHLYRLWVLLFSMGLLYVYFCPLVQALGATIQYGSPKPLDDGLPTLAQRACDSTPSVRACLAEVVGNWLLDLPDRYVYSVYVCCIWILRIVLVIYFTLITAISLYWPSQCSSSFPLLFPHAAIVYSKELLSLFGICFLVAVRLQVT